MNSPVRVLFLSGYTHPSQHRKVELLADDPGVEIVHVNAPDCGRSPGVYPSANGRGHYTLAIVPVRSLGQPDDAHRIYHWPPRLGLRRWQPQIIHCEREQEGLMALEVALLRDLFAPGAQLILYSWQNILRRRSLAVRLVSQLTMRSAQHMLCASSEAVSVLRRQDYRGGTSIMPALGLDTRYFYPRPVPKLRTRLGLDGFTVGYVGRLVKEKGIDTLLHAVSALTPPVWLLIVGSGPEEASLRDLVRGLGMGERCVFAGGVTLDGVAEYLNAMDVLVLPSRTTPNWKEQFGRVLVEAMACRVAVIGSDSGAIPEVIADPKWIFPEENSQRLAELIRRLIQEPNSLNDMIERNYRHALSLYEVSSLAQSILGVWQNLMRTDVQRVPATEGRNLE